MAGKNNTKCKVSDEIRKELCRRYDEGQSIPKICSEFGNINSKTITSILRIYRTTGRQMKNHKGSSTGSRKLSSEDHDFIKTKIHEDVSISLKQLKAELQQERNKIISISTIYRAIGEFNFSFKRLQLVPVKRNVEENMIRRRDYASSFFVQDEDKFIFIDEMGISCSTRKSGGWSAKGTTPRKVVQSIRSKNYSVCAAISKRQLILFSVQDKPYNTLTFTDFIGRLINKLQENNCCETNFVLDNASIHKSENLKNVIELNGYTLQFLPPYSPQLNPIEEVFSKWKSYIKSCNCTNVEELNNAILNGSFKISSNDCVAYFNHVKQFAMKALNMEEF